MRKALDDMDEKRLAQRLEWINQHPEVELKHLCPKWEKYIFHPFYQNCGGRENNAIFHHNKLVNNKIYFASASAGLSWKLLRMV